MESIDYKQFDKARRFLGCQIQDTCRTILSTKLPDTTGLQDLLDRILLDTLSDTFPPEKPVGSAEEFVLVTRTIFSDEYCRHFLRRAKEFDRVSGVAALSDVFLSTQPIYVWVKTISSAMVSDAQAAADVELGLAGPSKADYPASSSNESTASQPGQPAQPAQPAQAAHSPNMSVVSQPLTLIPSDGCPIQDIVLSGRTIRDAWFANEEARLMEEEACSHILRNGSWDPSQTHQMPVYHGTPGPLCGTGRLAVDDTFEYKLTHFWTVDAVLLGSVSENQVAPSIPSLPVVWTAFSPLRCFLWATFESDVLRDIPPMGVSRYMVKEWHCPRGPHVHRGVRLLKFRPSLSGDLHCNSYVMPNGLQDNWRQAARAASRELRRAAAQHDSAGDAWRYLRFLHGQETASWPNILHCHEVALPERMFRLFTKQLWRTMWFGKGIDALNASRDSIMSISLNITDDGDRKGKGK